MIKHITQNEFEKEVTASPVPVILDFYADWCGPCRAQGKILEALAPGWEGKVKIVKANVDEEPEFAEYFNIETIPTLVFFRDGKKTGEYSGVLEKEGLRRMLEV